MNLSEELLRRIVEQVIRETLGKSEPDFEKHIDPSGIILIKSDTVKCEPFAGAKGVYLKDVTTLEEAPRMGCGIMELDKGCLEWTLTYDEYDIVLEGVLEIETNGRIVTAQKGDIIYIPRNSRIHFQTPSKTRYAYFVYPADWQNAAST